MELLVIWLLIAVVTAIIASSKGRDGFGWFLIAILLGPFALILSMAMPKVVTGEHRRCEQCAELIRVEAVKCRHCGSEVAPPAAPPPYKAPPPPIVTP